jgi:signal peptidase I
MVLKFASRQPLPRGRGSASACKREQLVERSGRFVTMPDSPGTMKAVQPANTVIEDQNFGATAKTAPADPPRGFIAEWTVTIVLLLFGTTTLVQAFVIPTGSMEDTLLVGDHLLVDKLAYAPGGTVMQHMLPYSDVKRGDIIVFRYPVDIRQTFVKRVMGVPGDRIHLTIEPGADGPKRHVYLNGHMLNEPYVVHKLDYPDSYRDNFPRGEINTMIYPPAQQMLEKNMENGDIVVPQGFYFAMGDNRDQSLDSRYWGFVPRENIIGKPLIIYWSYDASTEDLSNPGATIPHLIDMVIHFPTKTRWSRSLRLIHSYPVQ